MGFLSLQIKIQAITSMYPEAIDLQTVELVKKSQNDEDSAIFVGHDSRNRKLDTCRDLHLDQYLILCQNYSSICRQNI